MTHYRGTIIQMIADISSETREARKQVKYPVKY